METTLEFRLMRAGEEIAVCELIARVFNGFVAPDYSAEGVAEFFKYAKPDALARRTQAGHFVLVAVSQSNIVGMIEIRDNHHVSLLFVDKQFLRRGIARGLLHRAVDICRRRKPDLAEMSVNSSLYAVPIYEKLGFRPTSPEQEKNGIRFIPMVLEFTKSILNEGINLNFCTLLRFAK